MNNNDILRRLRYTLNYTDQKMISIFALTEKVIEKDQLIAWLKKDDDEEQQKLRDIDLSSFLNGLIIEKRGKKDGPLPKPEKTLINNTILRKLKIAFNLKDDDMINIFALADFEVSKHELSALFRKPTQSQYRICKDQFLRNFLHGLQLKLRQH